MTAHSNRSRIPWWLWSMLALALVLLTVRLGVHAYCCYVVDTRTIRHPYIMPTGPMWLHQMLGRRWSYFAGEPDIVGLNFVTPAQRSEISHVFWCLLQLSTLNDLLLVGEGVTDVEVLQLRLLPELRDLSLRDTLVTARGLAVLDALPRLRDLHLCNSNLVDDVALVTISRSPELRSLRLDGTGISDTGLAQLSTLIDLLELSLDGTQIGDAGLLELRHLKNLRLLSVSGTRVTDAGVQALREVLPELDVTDD